MKLKIKRMHKGVLLPKYATPGSACFDIFADIEYGGSRRIFNNHSASSIVPTGLMFEVPEGWVLKIYSRSGQAFKDNTRLANCVGIIDEDYRGELMVKLTRDDGGVLDIRHGDRIAQGMLERVEPVFFEEVDELSPTARGEGGLGSTGA